MNKNKTMWGTHASVDIISNGICKKIYTDQTLISIKDHVITPEVFETLKRLNLETFVKLYNYQYDFNRNQIISYTMEYYDSKYFDIMNIDLNYFYNCFNNIYNDVLTLTKNNILLGDVNFSNIIFGDIIKIIDFDNYKLSTLTFTDILNNNKKELCFGFKGLYKIAIYDEYTKNGYIRHGMDNLMKLFDPSADNLPLHIKKRLLKYDNMLDYLKNNR